jgi:TctA family transporter
MSTTDAQPATGTQPTTNAQPYAWLHSSSTRAASDVCLAVILLIAGTVAIQAALSLGLGGAERLEAGSYPFVIGSLLLAIGIAALLRAVVLRKVEHGRWSIISIVVITAVILAVQFASWQWGRNVALLFGPAEFVALIVFQLALAIALVRASRIRAIGMVLLGLLIGTVGVDVETGVDRLTMGLDSLADGVMLATVVLGFAVADGVLGVVSPSLLLASYARKVGHRLADGVRLPIDLILRIACALMIAAALYAAYLLDGREWPVEQIAIFAAFGVACQIFDWNRLVLLFAITVGPLLEEDIRRAHLIARGDFTVYFARPISAAVLALAIAIVLVALMLSARPMLRRRQAASG